MKNNGYIFWRILAIVLVAAILAGGAFAAYRYGYAQGVAQSPAFTEALKEGLKNGDGSLVAPGLGYGAFPGYGFGHMGMMGRGFHPLGGLFGLLIGVCIFFALLRMIFRPHWGYPGHMHGMGRHWGPPPWAGWQQPGAEEQKADEAPAEKK